MNTAAGRRRLLMAGIALLAIGTVSLAQESNGWRQVFFDDFNRPTLGANWRWIFPGNGRMYLPDNAVHISHGSGVQCVIPLPYGESRVELDLIFPKQSFSGTNSPHSINLELRGGEFGAGGNDENFEAVFVPGDESGDPAVDSNGNIRIVLDQTYHVVMQISGDIGSVSVNGKPLLWKDVGPARSEINRYFTFRAVGLNGAVGKEAVLDNFKMWAGPKAVCKLPLRPNSAEENRQATRKAADFMDHANPAPGMQQAIDSLPPSGGLVILPEGEFSMRRHLRLRNNVTLRGQGAGKTILKADPCGPVPILDLKSGRGECVVTVATNDIAKFQVGDGVCFDDNWGHPGEWPLGVRSLTNIDCVVMAVSGNQITVRGAAPSGAKSLRRWFPLVFAHCAEFVELKDLTLIGGDGGWGGFQSAAITFGRVAGARVTRVQIAKWLGDGFSLQTGSDAMVTDNTVSNTQAGYHPGTLTHRFLWTRNLGLGNRACGLYFCYWNRAGVYYRNTLDWFDGYAWPRDVFDIIAGNVCVSTNGFTIEQGEGGGGVIFNNRFAKIRIGHSGPGITYDFLVAENRADSLSFVPTRDIRRNMFIGNMNATGEQPLKSGEVPSNNFFAAQGAGFDMKRYPVGIERIAPAEPPALPQPVLDGQNFYSPRNPAAGFQKALNQIGEKRRYAASVGRLVRVKAGVGGALRRDAGRLRIGYGPARGQAGSDQFPAHRPESRVRGHPQPGDPG